MWYARKIPVYYFLTTLLKSLNFSESIKYFPEILKVIFAWNFGIVWDSDILR